MQQSDMHAFSIRCACMTHNSILHKTCSTMLKLIISASTATCVAKLCSTPALQVPTSLATQASVWCRHNTCFDNVCAALQKLHGSLCFAQVVTEPSEAEFILCHGTEALGQPDGTEAKALDLDDIKSILQTCAQQSKAPPMVVANPDVVTVSGSSLIPMPGTLAEYYAELGGQVWCICIRSAYNMSNMCCRGCKKSKIRLSKMTCQSNQYGSRT